MDNKTYRTIDAMVIMHDNASTVFNSSDKGDSYSLFVENNEFIFIKNQKKYTYIPKKLNHIFYCLRWKEAKKLVSWNLAKTYMKDGLTAKWVDTNTDYSLDRNGFLIRKPSNKLTTYNVAFDDGERWEIITEQEGD